MSSGKVKGFYSDWKFEAFALSALVSLLVWLTAAPIHGSRQSSVPKRLSELSSLKIPSLTSPSFPVGGDELNRRGLYPYSIIPGGVESADELRKAITNDRVVAAHYTGFDLSLAHIVLLAAARSAFVSYRKGDAVFWTTKKITVPAGETVITDGTHTSRTRCGNQLSDVPRYPVAPAEEPQLETLATPLLVEILAPLDLPPLELPLGLPLESAPVAAQVFRGGGSTEGAGDTSGITVSPGGDSPSSQAVPPAPIATPEPSTLLLTVGGLAAILLRRAGFFRIARKHENE